LAVAAIAMSLPLPVAELGGLIALTAATNVALALRLSRSPEVSERAVFGVLAVDTAILTGLLALAGGPSNPFSVLYLVHVTIAALVLGRVARWTLVALATGSYALLFFAHRPLQWMGHHHHAGALHLQGMWIAFAITATLISIFVARVAGALAAREEELRHAQMQAARAEKLVSLSTLAAGSAHELGTPLATIAVVANELERALPEDLAGDARLVRREVERCRAILLRMRSGDIAGEASEHIAVSDLLSAVRAQLPPTEAEKLVLEHNGETLWGPKRALAQTLASLVRNAFDATTDGASVELRVRAEDDRMRFVIDDRGRGMTAEEIARVGEPFFTTKPPGCGMGLGVFLGRKLATALGGSLTFYRKDRGTTAVLELPRV
jgi:two-component system sensor histidine kinase RegB